MNSLEILRSFTDEEFYKVWCIVHYNFNGKRDTLASGREAETEMS